jgi:hypothetical protein
MPPESTCASERLTSFQTIDAGDDPGSKGADSEYQEAYEKKGKHHRVRRAMIHDCRCGYDPKASSEC